MVVAGHHNKNDDVVHKTVNTYRCAHFVQKKMIWYSFKKEEKCMHMAFFNARRPKKSNVMIKLKYDTVMRHGVVYATSRQIILVYE